MVKKRIGVSVHRRSIGRGNKTGLPLGIRSMGIRPKIVVEGDVLVEDHHQVLDRSRGRGTTLLRAGRCRNSQLTHYKQRRQRRCRLIFAFHTSPNQVFPCTCCYSTVTDICQVARLITSQPRQNGNVIRQQLQREITSRMEQKFRSRRNVHDMIDKLRNLATAFDSHLRSPVDIPAR